MITAGEGTLFHEKKAKGIFTSIQSKQFGVSHSRLWSYKATEKLAKREIISLNSNC